MRPKHRVKEILRFVAFAFYPRTTLIACFVFSAILIVILGIVMAALPRESIWYNIVFALTTGAAGSFFVSFVVELTGNYRHNKLAWYELQEYYSAVMQYECYKQVLMQLTPHQRAEKKAHEEFAAAGGVEELDEEDEPKDSIQVVWKLLPKIIPAFKRTLEDKKEFLSDEEINELENILSDYHLIRSSVQERIMLSPMTYDALNHPDTEYLKTIFLADVIENMPEWIRKHLASEESSKACDRYADAILSDEYLLSQFMRDYDISQKGIDVYQDQIDHIEKEEETELEDIDYDELNFDEPDDEDTFRAQNEEFNKQMEQKHRPFVSWNISRCCQNISESVDVLEKSILKKPYYGMSIKYYKNAENEPLDDILSVMSYESEKRQLDKRLAKQKKAGNGDIVIGNDSKAEREAGRQ